MSAYTLKHISKIYDGHVQAVVDFNLEINDQEFIVIVGPSGCGKSTVLRMIAGLESISSGELFIHGQFMNEIEPKDRDIAMVFQSNALYPHFTVYENMAFGLKRKKIPQKEIDGRVKEAARILEITEILDRKPASLSGGQCQRAALGRAIVRDANLLLFDEPLSSLDAKLRVQMRSEIVKLHKRLGATTIYVTHDQIEAMTMASRIVVMNEGRIQQIGTPEEVYKQPATVFVAGFMGMPPANILQGTYDCCQFHIDEAKLEIPTKYQQAMEPYQGKQVLLGIRPEDLHVEDSKYSKEGLPFCVELSELLGSECILYGKIGSQNAIVKVSSSMDIKVSSVIYLHPDVSKIHVFDIETKMKII